ncbi:hypothetical protein LSAT2_019260 [Lamellibrachia satsuma]|nr:hypothetical protein LSAT2_019260 [Lamellibrachia satsuma]
MLHNRARLLKLEVPSDSESDSDPDSETSSEDADSDGEAEQLRSANNPMSQRAGVAAVEGTADLVGVLLSNRSHILTQLRGQWDSLSVKFVRQNDSLRALRLQFHDIDTQVEAMHKLPSGVDQLQKDVVKQMQKLAIVEGDWQRKFQRLADNVTSQVSIVSKMQGPPGVGNLTIYRHNKYSSGSAAAAVSDTTTAWIPHSQQEANDLVVMGMECTTYGGTGSYLETKEATGWNGLQYRCVCFGNAGCQVSRDCELHIWQCPRLS